MKVPRFIRNQVFLKADQSANEDSCFSLLHHKVRSQAKGLLVGNSLPSLASGKVMGWKFNLSKWVSRNFHPGSKVQSRQSHLITQLWGGAVGRRVGIFHITCYVTGARWSHTV